MIRTKMFITIIKSISYRFIQIKLFVPSILPPIKLFKITFSSPEPDKSVNSQNYIPLIQQISIIRPVRVHHANCDIVRGTRLMDTLDLSV